MSTTDTAILTSIVALVGTLIVGLLTLLGKRGDQSVAASGEVTEQEKQIRAELRLDIASARSERDQMKTANDKLEEQNEILTRQVKELQSQNELLKAQADKHVVERSHDKAKLEVMQERITKLEEIIDGYRYPKRRPTGGTGSEGK